MAESRLPRVLVLEKNMIEMMDNKDELSLTADDASMVATKEKKDNSEILCHYARILVVEDEEVIRNLMGKVLSMLDYKAVTFADGGQKALHIILEAINENKPFDLVITDVSMGKEENGGLSLCKTINYLEESAKPAVIVSTGLMNNKLIEDSLEQVGVSCFLPKPFKIKKVKELLNEVLNQYFEKKKEKKERQD